MMSDTFVLCVRVRESENLTLSEVGRVLMSFAFLLSL